MGHPPVDETPDPSAASIEEKQSSTGAASPQNQSDASEVNLKACLSLFGAFFGLYISFGWVNCIALFQAQYETHQLRRYSSSTVSWITSTELFLMLFISPVAGFLFDNYGPRVPIIIGGFLEVFGLMMASLSTEYYQFMLSQAVVAGIGASLVFSPSMTAAMSYFRRYRALAGGISVAGSSIGGIIFPIMVNNLMPKIGYGWTMRCCAFMILGLWAIVLVTISSKIPVQRREFHLASYVEPFGQPNFLLLCACAFFLYWGIMVPFNYLSVSAISRGMSMSMALNLVPIMNGGSFIGRVVPNFLADKYGRFNLLALTLLFTAVITLALWLPGRSNAAIIVFVALFGIGSGACIGLLPALLMTVFTSHKEVGFRMGATLAVGGIASLTSPPIGGAIATASGGSYDNAFIFSAICLFISIVFLLLLRGRVAGWKLREMDPSAK